VKRYRFYLGHYVDTTLNIDRFCPDMIEDKDGEYVKWDDVKDIIEKDKLERGESK